MQMKILFTYKIEYPDHIPNILFIKILIILYSDEYLFLNAVLLNKFLFCLFLMNEYFLTQRIKKQCSLFAQTKLRTPFEE